MLNKFLFKKPANKLESYGKHTKEQIFFFKTQDGGFVKAFKNI